ncbi:MAG: hypothetical protein ACD_61C00304G0001 [uncultured bacterium]|nr:MAG: hypothetical protein ACD_61C00304G0001 [uncultured bacterium]
MNWSFETARKYVYSVLFALAILIFLTHYFVSGQAVYGDGIGYYSHLHSWVIDRDWDYTNEYRHIYDSEHNNAIEDTLSPSVQIVSTTPEGKAENFYGTGVAVLLLPFYLLAHLIALTINFFGAGISTLGYGDWYQILTGVGAVIYSFLGLFFLEKVINLTVQNRKISLISSVSIFLSTSLFYYSGFDVINSHFASFFLSALFFYLFLRKDCWEYSLLLGLIAGLMTITRPQDSIVVLIWCLSSLANYFSGKKPNHFRILMGRAKKFLTGYIFAFSPMIIHWIILFGNPLNHPYWRGLVERVQSKPVIDIFGSFFNPVTGLFYRTPLLLVLFIYFLYLLIRKENLKNLKYPLLFFLGQFLIITVQGGWAAAAYGGRMYLSSLVFFALLLGKLLLQISKKRMAWAYLFVGTFICLNLVSMMIFILRDKGVEGGKFGTEQRTIQRLKNLRIYPSQR